MLGFGELENLLPSPKIGRGVGGEGKTHTLSRFQLKLTDMGTAVPLRVYLIPIIYEDAPNNFL
jgi:hypothetical protein